MTTPEPLIYAELADSMEAGCFAPAEFNHIHHVGTAFELLKRHDFTDALGIYARAIRQFANSVGAADKFNTTITVSFMAVIAGHMKPGQDVDTFLAANPELRSPKILEQWYSKEQLETDSARKIFLMPGVN